MIKKKPDYLGPLNKKKKKEKRTHHFIGPFGDKVWGAIGQRTSFTFTELQRKKVNF